MLISTEIESAASLVGEEKAVELCAKAGFDAWDFTMTAMCDYDWSTKTLRLTNHPLAGPQYLQFARQLRQIGLDNGIHCNQSHAPHPTSCAGIRDLFKRAIECTAEAGGSICVIHPDNFKSAEENAEMYLQLLPFAKNCGMKIATENMYGWDSALGHGVPQACATPADFCAHLDAVNDGDFVACLDIGHAQMRGMNTSAVELIHALGGKLQALHIHDNDLWHDSHQLPGSMQINFIEILKALKQIGYSGYFTLEARKYLRAYTQQTAFDGLRALADSARRLAALYETEEQL